MSTLRGAMVSLLVLGCASSTTTAVDAAVVGLNDPPRVLGDALRDAYRAAASAFLRQKTTAAQYVAASKSLSAQRRLLEASAERMTAWQRGDADGDFVPDELDACPASDSTLPVDEKGCVLTVDPAAGPTDEQVRLILERLGLGFSRDCVDAPVPQTPGALKYGYDSARRTVAFALAPVTNQPAGCAVFYELRVVLGGPGGTFDPTDSTHRLIFRDQEATERTSRLVFRVGPTDTGERLRVYDASKYHAEHLFQVRAMNGSGQVSPWSPMVSSALSFGEL